MRYRLEDLVRTAKRLNNPRRSYLYVDPLQGKHIPADPAQVTALFKALAQMARSRYGEERLLVIGFSETATAIGEAVALELGTAYVKTTREQTQGGKPLFFTESHSHAAQQKLASAGLAEKMAETDRILFVEDEVTTGNTIEKLMQALCGFCPAQTLRFGILSILNSMTPARLAHFAERAVPVDYIYPLPQAYHQDEIGQIEGLAGETVPPVPVQEVPVYPVYPECNPITVCDTAQLRAAYAHFEAVCRRMLAEQPLAPGGRVLCLGTEECMYPAIRLGVLIGQLDPAQTVRTHATTRSPIEVSTVPGYPLQTRYALPSLYEAGRQTYLYNIGQYDRVYIVTDAMPVVPEGLEQLCRALYACGSRQIILIQLRPFVGMHSSYAPEEVTLLLKDITGQVEPLPAAEREKRIQSGTHYCEMLPLEYRPSPAYLTAYEQALESFGAQTAQAAVTLAEKLYAIHGRGLVLVSLARAGIPVGILLHRYLRRRYGFHVPHYAVSIIRGRGIDANALRYILARHAPDGIQFVDGWVGKGAILGQLRAALADFPTLSPALAVLSDPACLTDLCGTHEDILIPSSCLNATVTGLLSRTFLRQDIIGAQDFHGAAYYRSLAADDLSEAFLSAIEAHFPACRVQEVPPAEQNAGQIIAGIARHYGIADINLIKPGIGEATRVLLRRLPWKILVNPEAAGSPALEHLRILALEKGVPYEESAVPLGKYKVCGLIRQLGDV